ncbi:hypothetical protein ACTOVL_05945 [Arcanobacterium canis]
MKIQRVQLDHAQIGQFLKSQQVSQLVWEQARHVASRAGDGYMPSLWVGSTRVIGSVETVGVEAMIKNSKHNVLLRALGGA